MSAKNVTTTTPATWDDYRRILIGGGLTVDEEIEFGHTIGPMSSAEMLLFLDEQRFPFVDGETGAQRLWRIRERP